MLSQLHNDYIIIISLTGFAKYFFLQKSELTMEVSGWVQVSLWIFFIGKSFQIALYQYWYFGVVYHDIVYSVCIHC